MNPGRQWLAPVVAFGVLGAGLPVRHWQYQRSIQAPAPPSAPVGPLGFELVERAKDAGLVHHHRKYRPHRSILHVGPLIQAFGQAGVAVADYDDDGWPDVYLASTEQGTLNRLYRNNGDGTFTDVAAKLGLADVNRPWGSQRPLFFDFDNDGRKDLLLQTIYCVRLFRNVGTRFLDVTKQSGLEHCGYGYASNAVDYDGDGDMDVVLGDFFRTVDFQNPKTLRFMWNATAAGVADNGGPIVFFRNDGGGRFSKLPDANGIKSRGWTHAIGVYDLRGTGRPDLYFATDFGHDQLYLNENARYRDASKRADKGLSHFGMSAEIADADNDGRPVVFVSEAYEPGFLLGRNYAAKFEGDGPASSVAERHGVAACGWAWGAKYLDLDNDGWQDLAVANGMISNSKERHYWYHIGLLEGVDRKIREHVDAWPAIEDRSLAGHQRKCLFVNRKGKFEDVATQTPLGSDRSDGRAMAAIDYRNDGSLSLIQSSLGTSTRLYSNRARPDHAWIGFKLLGTKSPRDAWGSRMKVKLKDGMTLTRELQPANGFLSQSDERLHFGLGQGEIESIEIRWPSGKIQNLRPLEPRRYHRIEEPRD